MVDEFYMHPSEETVDFFKSSIDGLSSDAISDIRSEYGRNILVEPEGVSKLSLFFEQFKDFLTYILVFAAVISILIGEIPDAILITIILFGNAALGFFQEYKAEQALESIKEYLSLSATVRRDGKIVSINAEDLVPGDILLLEAGNKIPADARIISCDNLFVDESMLTGESLPVEKNNIALDKKTPIAECFNMLFMGTDIVRGSAAAIVVGTGMRTEIGSIARLIDTKEQTYFQKKLDILGKTLGKVVLVIALIVFVLGALSNEPLVEMALISLSLAVAAIPEGLPAVVTISLSLGVRKMAIFNAIVKRLPAAETLGSCTVICSDKTGTITKNMMTVRMLYIPGQELSIEDASADVAGVQMLMKIGFYCNSSSLEGRIGDPTELALLDSAQALGVSGHSAQVAINPFDSERKRMSVICKEDGRNTLYCKGATEQVLNICDRIMIEGEIRPILQEDKDAILKTNDKYASMAMRVLGFAYSPVNGLDTKEDNLIFAGLQAMIDPPKDGVKDAISKCAHAGIRVVMITGDHALTAKAIAKEVGIFSEGDIVLTGAEIDKMDDKSLLAVVKKVTIYARVNPEHKLRIIQTLRESGDIMAMTGDGVNDAPALKNADIGVAMNSGTDVAKESADMVLLDDNFATIVASVEEGRHIFDNIRKFVRYLLSTNFGEVFTIFLASLVGFPLPLVAVQILWINLLTDGLPALSLAFEDKEPAIMERPPRKPHENIVDRSMAINIGYIGLIMAIGTLYLYSIAPEGKGMTIAFTTLVLFQLVNVFNCRSFTESVFSRKYNKYLIGAVLISLALQLMVIYVDPLSGVFRTEVLGAREWVLIIFVSSSLLIIEEARKLLFTKRPSL
ncbi:MAG: calcium-translocating P-type ATPase, PMCA-type [Candidatus Methanofastidiosia archaeon]